jgi:lipopolysaccharide export LptBFGC system permease protein LptF
MKYLTCCLFLCLTLSGCANFSQSQKSGTLASGALTENLNTTDRELTIAGKTADPVTKSHIVSAQSSNSQAKAKLPAISKALEDFDAVNKDDQRQHASFWSDRQRALFWWIVGSTFALIAVVAVLYFLTSFSGPIGAVATVAFHVVTLGTAWVIGRFSEWVNRSKVKQP